MRKSNIGDTMAKKFTLTGMAIGAGLLLAPHAAADPPTQAVQLDSISYPYCAIQADRVNCLGGQGWPTKVAFVASTGEFKWRSGSSLGGDQPFALVPGQTYHWLGWTVLASSSDMTFTNDATGHGMTVNGNNVTPF